MYRITEAWYSLAFSGSTKVQVQGHASFAKLILSARRDGDERQSKVGAVSVPRGQQQLNAVIVGVRLCQPRSNRHFGGILGGIHTGS